MLRRPRIVTGSLLAALGLCLAAVGLAQAESPNRTPRAPHHMIDGKVVAKTVTTSTFHGVKANVGTVTHTANAQGGCTLTLSDDFVVPETPAPHWQVVDSDGNVYLLNRLVIKDDKFNKSINVPAYVPNVAKVQIWCAWAEALLGEAEFAEPVD